MSEAAHKPTWIVKRSSVTLCLTGLICLIAANPLIAGYNRCHCLAVSYIIKLNLDSLHKSSILNSYMTCSVKKHNVLINETICDHKYKNSWNITCPFFVNITKENNKNVNRCLI